MAENKIELSGIFKKGYGIIPKALMQRQDLSISEKAIIAYFLSFTGGGTTCFPSYSQICNDLKISKTTLSKSIHNIENKGYIKISALYPNDKLKHNYKYELTFIEGTNSEPSEVQNLNLPVKECEPSRVKILNSNNNIINNNNNNNNNNIFKIEYPDHLNNKIFITKYNEWIQFRKDIKKPIKTNRSINEQIKMLAQHDINTAIKIIDNSIMNEWQGLFPLKESKPAPKTFGQMEDDEVRKYVAEQAKIRKQIESSNNKIIGIKNESNY